MSSFDGGRPPHLILPAIDRIPVVAGSDVAEQTVLKEFLRRGATPWEAVPVPVPRTAATGLWVILAVALGIGGWLAAVRAGSATCSGFPCAVATWGGPELMLVLAALSVAVLVGTAVLTRGFRRTGPVGLAAAIVGAGCGLVAVSGVVALLLLGAASLAVALLLLATFIDRF